METGTGSLSLCGTWKLNWDDGQRGGRIHHTLERLNTSSWLDAEVPGEIHLDLMKAGILEEPTIGVNCLHARWVEECLWTYRTTFDCPEEALSAHTWLNFEGLDYAATVFLNGVELGTHANFFLPWKVDVSGKLKSGVNTLVVMIESGLYSVAEKPIAGYYVPAQDKELHKRVWLRKPQSSFGWDWSTRLINLGIHKPVLLEWTRAVRVDHVVVTADVDACLETGKVGIKLHVSNLGDKTVEGQLQVEVEGTQEGVLQHVTLLPGQSVVAASCTVENPALWWPVGYGEQRLYNVRCRLSANGHDVHDSTKKIGFRHVEINQDPHPDAGTYFTIHINGEPVFAKGANFVPSDMIFARIDRARYETLIDRALEANFNFLRVWGGGLYESDDFYELCDKHGILVWQDFIFACGSYPTTDEEFMQSVQAEITHQVRRLASHPSLVVWCGNNENEMLTWNRDEGVYYPDHALYHLVIPRILKSEDPSRYYQPTSPFSSDWDDPNSDTTGDQHPWGIGFENNDFRQYREMTSRFPNEGGMLGPTSLPTMRACLLEGQQNIHSFSWRIHDNSVDWWFPESAPDRLLQDWLGVNTTDLPLEAFVYYGGLLQGEALREYIENFRRRKWSSSSAIFWMYNDCWPATRSWTIVDYYLRRTPGFHPVRRAFAPISVVIVLEEGSVHVYGLNDTKKSWHGELRYGLLTVRGKYPMNETRQVHLTANSSTLLASFSFEKWNDIGIRDSIAFGMLEQNQQLVARNRLILPRYHEMNWVPAEVDISREEGCAVFRSDVFAMGVCIDLEGERSLPDNFFDVWPGMPYRIPWDESLALPDILNALNTNDAVKA